MKLILKKTKITSNDIVLWITMTFFGFTIGKIVEQKNWIKALGKAGFEIEVKENK